MPSDVTLHGSRRWLVVIGCLIAGTVIGVAGYYSGIPFATRLWVRAALSLVFLAATVPARRHPDALETLLAFFAVSVGLLIAGLFLAGLSDRLGVSPESPQGFALDKIGESIPIVVMIAMVSMLGRRGQRSLSLRGGSIGRSLLWGGVVGIVLLAYFLASGGWQLFDPGILPSFLPVAGWVAVFSVVNGFTEELWFRGLFQSRLGRLLGDAWGMWLTAVLFGMLHLFGSFGGTLGTYLLAGITLLLGIAFGAIVRRTGSIWGAVLGHFFADFFFVLGYFATRT